jgi:purine-binding chemotaxis protein CheW
MGDDNTKKNNEDLIQTYLSFKLGDELFAANVENVLNILEMHPITKVPHSPDYLKGVINLRGNVLPVTDMRIKFGLPEIEVTKDTCILVLNVNIEGENVMLGAMVDSVKEVLEVESSKVEPPPTIGAKYKSEFINGMWMVNDEFIMLLNLDLVFTSNEIAFLSKDLEEVIN